MPALGRQRMEDEFKARPDYSSKTLSQRWAGKGKKPGTSNLLLKPWWGAAESLQKPSLAEKADGF